MASHDNGSAVAKVSGHRTKRSRSFDVSPDNDADDTRDPDANGSAASSSTHRPSIGRAKTSSIGDSGLTADRVSAERSDDQVVKKMKRSKKTKRKKESRKKHRKKQRRRHRSRSSSTSRSSSPASVQSSAADDDESAKRHKRKRSRHRDTGTGASRLDLAQHKRVLMFRAVERGQLDRAADLFATGAVPDPDDPNAVDLLDDDGLTMLHHAAAAGHASICRWLLAMGADPTLPTQNSARETPLHLACEYKHYEIAALLVDNGADGQALDGAGRSPVDLGLDHLLAVAATLAYEAELARLQAELQREQRLEADQKARAEREWREKLELAHEGDHFDWAEEWMAQHEGAHVMTDDQYVDHLRKEMGARRAAVDLARSAAFAFETDEQRSRRTQAAEAAAQRAAFDQFVRDKIAKEEAERERLRQQRRAQSLLETATELDRRWNAFVSQLEQDSAGLIRFEHVPFPSSLDADTVIKTGVGYLSEIILPSSAAASAAVPSAVARAPHGSLSHVEKTALFRKAYLRWHPDKFAQSFGSRLEPADRDRILNQVTAVAQYLNRIKDHMRG